MGWAASLVWVLLVGCVPREDGVPGSGAAAPVDVRPGGAGPDAARDRGWPEALVGVRAAGPEGLERRLGELFKAWAAEDEAAARAGAAGLTEFEERLAAHEGLLAAALARDPRAAIEWLRGLEPKALAEVLLDQALADWAGVDASGAGRYVVELGASDYRTVLAGELARAWAAKDGAAAMAWGAGLQDQEAREEALTEAVHTVAATDPRSAAEGVLKIEHDAARTDALELAVIAWWERDPAAVTAWAEGIRDADLRAQARRLVEAQKEAAGR